MPSHFKLSTLKKDVAHGSKMEIEMKLTLVPDGRESGEYPGFLCIEINPKFQSTRRRRQGVNTWLVGP